MKLGKLDCANAIRQRRPFTGAWIETWLATVWAKPLNVAPSRGRGLKHIGGDDGRLYLRRPFTGAWIETNSPQISCPWRQSPLHGGVD